jgi:hypothetical protein
MLGREDAVGDPHSEIPDPGSDQMLSDHGCSLFFTAVEAAWHTECAEAGSYR